ncbi:MAG: hypothetical protein GXP28_08025 [Planctomycetes bacterium]|nr:hypothetical protein [Planctomycetota bacterium]
MPTNSRRRGFLGAIFFGALVVLVTLGHGSLPVLAQQSAVTPASPGRKITLKQQLVVGLKATTTCDRDFLGIVVNLVETGRLPRRLVDSTFLWARDRAARKSRLRALRPMIYFKPALVLRARRIGVKLPANCPAGPSTTS